MSAYDDDVRVLRDLTPRTPDVAIVLGSGLDSVVDALEERVEVSYRGLRGMAGPELIGHAGSLAVGEVAGRSVLCFRGRHHLYQGFSAYEVSYPVRLARALGAETLLVTNASGSVDSELHAGSLMAITDHLNLTGHNPLVGWATPDDDNPFVPMGGAYDADLRALARACASELGLELAEGVYAGLTGPSYETPAEVAWLRSCGANAVGMSTVCEVIAARALSMRVLGLSLVTNAAGVVGLSHHEVLAAGERGSRDLIRLLVAILGRL